MQMKVIGWSFIRAFLKRWRKLTSEVLTSPPYEQIHWFGASQKAIPCDVPKGYFVVYVGEEHKRFVISVSFIHHRLFQTLLDQAHEEYQFINPEFKLCLPCDENTFTGILCDVATAKKQDQKIWLCF